MVRVGLGESGGLVGGHELRGITWRGGLCGTWRVGCEEEYMGVERRVVGCSLVLFIYSAVTCA